MTEMTQVETAQIPQFDAFELLPDALVRIELRSIGWQTLQVDALGCHMGQKLLDGVAAVER
jgi:hypothetical protein